MFPDLCQERNTMKGRWVKSTSTSHKHPCYMPLTDSLFFSHPEYVPTAAPPSFLCSAFIGQHILWLLPQEHLSGPFPHFHHHWQGQDGGVLTYHRKNMLPSSKGLFLPYLNFFLATVHNDEKIIFWKIKSDYKYPWWNSFSITPVSSG